MFRKLPVPAPICTHSSAHVCHLTRLIHVHLRVLASHSVAQSQATAISVEAEHDDIEQNPTADSANNGQPGRQNSHDARKNFRRWKPHNAEQLGVNVLGKPAEALILPESNRRLPSVPIEQEGKSAKHAQVSLDTELKPLSWEDIKENIENVKDNIVKHRDELSTGRWNKLQQTLASGFTSQQLSQYTQISAGGSTAFKLKQQKTTKKMKIRLAAEIMEKVWNLRLRHKEQESGGAQQQEDVRRESKTLYVGQGKQQLVFRYDDRRFKAICDLHQVQIDLYRAKSVIRVTGDIGKAARAKADLQKLLTSIVESRIRLSRHILGLLEDPSTAQAFFSTLKRKHRAMIIKQGNELLVFAWQKETAEKMRRDILVASEQDEQNAGWHALNDPGKETLVSVPSQVPEIRNWFQKRKSWCRYITKCFPDRAEISKLKSVRKQILQSLDKAKTESSSTKMRQIYELFQIDATAVKHEYSADIGQVVFSDGFDLVSNTSTTTLQGLSKLQFVPNYPMLAHYLAKKAALTWRLGQKEHPVLVRFRLRPLKQHSPFPIVEIIVAGDNASKGVQQQLQIRRVNLVLDHQSCDLILPSYAVDARLSRYASVELFSVGKTPDLMHLPFLRRLATHIEIGQSSKSHELPPVWTLDLSSLLRPSGGPAPNSKNIKTSSKKESHDSSRTVQNPEMAFKSVLRSIAGKAVYILEPAEILDGKSFIMPSVQGVYLDHIFCDTTNSELPRRPEVLRLTKSPFVNLVSGTNVSSDEGAECGTQSPSTEGEAQYTKVFDATMQVVEELTNLCTIR